VQSRPVPRVRHGHLVRRRPARRAGSGIGAGRPPLHLPL